MRQPIRTCPLLVFLLACSGPGTTQQEAVNGPAQDAQGTLGEPPAGPIGPATGFVLDQESILTPVEHFEMDSLFRAFKARTGVEIALVTSADMGGHADAEEFALGFARDYGVGKEGMDNGVVIAFSKARRDLYIAIGEGTGKAMNDNVWASIVDMRMLPHFQQDRHFMGLWEGSLALIDFLEE